jgi:hypothetical protein
MLRAVTGFVAECTDCGMNCWDGCERPPIYPDEATAVVDLARFGWQPADSVAGDVGAAGAGLRLRCRYCAGRVACAVGGHVLTPWLPCACTVPELGIADRLPGHDVPPGGVCRWQWRYCQRCHGKDTITERQAPDDSVAGQLPGDGRVVARQVVTAGGAR